MDLVEQNKIALAKLASFYEDKTLVEASSDDVKGFGSSVRIAGVRCSKCGGYITTPNLKFYNFSPHVQCYKCQLI